MSAPNPTVPLNKTRDSLGTAPPLQKQTTVGNYFISNYPPFAYWKQDRVGELQSALDRPPAPGVDLGLY